MRDAALRRLSLQWLAAAGAMSCSADAPRVEPPRVTPSAEPTAVAIDSVQSPSVPVVDAAPGVDSGAAVPSALPPSTPPSPATSPTAVRDAGPSRPPPAPSSWVVTREDSTKPNWCRTQSVDCTELLPTEKACPPARAQECERDGRWSPSVGVEPVETAACQAKLDLAVTNRERKRRPRACCYFMERRCMNPGEGRPYRALHGGDAWAPSARFATTMPRGPRAVAYLDMARFERASVPAFEGIAQDLIRLGAPDQLVRGARAAARDEAAHARAALRLASHFGAGGSRLILGAPPARAMRTRAELLLESLHEGCVGELDGALELRARAHATGDAYEARLLRTIAVDEERHALFSLRVIAWLVRAEAAPGPLRELLGREVHALEASASESLRVVVLPALRVLLADDARAPLALPPTCEDDGLCSPSS